MADPGWFNTLAPILLTFAGGGIAWIIRSRIEELRALEEKLHSD